MWCLQFSRRFNGGNQALGALYKEINSFENTKIIYLSRTPIKAIFFIFLRWRKTPVIVSDPICSILLWLSMRSKVVHFIQSDDINLFQDYGYLFNLTYKLLYKLMIKYTKWLRIFNSLYSIKYFAKRFEFKIDKSLIVPILGINELFPKQLGKRQKNNNTNFLWIGSKHSYKGGKLFVQTIKNSSFNGHMIFNGSIPLWAKGHSNISIEANLTREKVFSRLSKCSALVYTSKFDSFSLPIFEALLVGCPVIAIKNKCIEINKSTDYVTIASNFSELSEKLSNFKKLRANPTVAVNWKFERRNFLNWNNKIKKKINLIGEL